jgi:hypothetical protein
MSKISATMLAQLRADLVSKKKKNTTSCTPARLKINTTKKRENT